MSDLQEFKAGYRDYNRGIEYPRDWATPGPYKEGWQAAGQDDAEGILDGADAAFAALNPYQKELGR